MLPTQVKSTECDCVAVPVPDSVIVAGEFVAVLTNETVPENGPLMSGAKMMLTLCVAPAAIVNGKLRLAPNTPPVKFAADRVTDESPVFERVTVRTRLLPTRTLPKFTLAGDAVSR